MAHEHPVTDADADPDGLLRATAVERWVEAARDAYVEQCQLLRTRAADGTIALHRMPVAVGGTRPARAPNVVVTATATEVLPSSFVVAVRLRPLGGGDDRAVDFRCEVELRDPASGARVPLDHDVRDELIHLEHSARHYN